MGTPSALLLGVPSPWEEKETGAECRSPKRPAGMDGITEYAGHVSPRETSESRERVCNLEGEKLSHP